VTEDLAPVCCRRVDSDRVTMGKRIMPTSTTSQRVSHNSGSRPARTASLGRLLACAGVACGLILATTSVGVATAWAQPKPNPQPIKPPEPELPDIEKWARAYEQADRPRIAVFVAQTMSQVQTPSYEAFASVMDPSGITSKMKSAFERVINDPKADVELVDVESMQMALNRLKSTLEQGKEKDVVQMLGNELQVDLSIVMRLVPSQAAGSSHTVLFEARDTSRGRAGLTFTFDWKGGTDVPNIRDNMEAVARKFINDYADRSQGPRRFTLRIFGLDKQEMQTAALKAMKDADEVKRIRSRGTAMAPNPFRGGQTTASAEFEVTLEDGADTDQILVQDNLVRALKENMEINVEPRRTEGGMLAFRVIDASSERQAANADACADQIMALNDRGQQLREQWMNLYRQRNSPRIAVLINRARTTEEKDRIISEGGSPDNIGTQIVISNAGIGPAVSNTGDGVSDSSTNRERDESLPLFEQPSRLEFQARTLEGQIGRLFNVGRMGSTQIIDADVARQGILKDLDKQKTVFDQNELVNILKNQNIADVLIIGYGFVDKGVVEIETIDNRSSDTTPNGGRIIVNQPGKKYASTVKYTFKVVNLADSRQIAIAEASGFEESFTNEGITDLATRLVGQMACDMKLNWQPPLEATMRFTNVQNQEDADLIMRAIREHAKGITMTGAMSFDGGAGQGVAESRVSYTMTSDDVPAELRRIVKAAKLPFSFKFVKKVDNLLDVEVMYDGGAAAGSESSPR